MANARAYRGVLTPAGGTTDTLDLGVSTVGISETALLVGKILKDTVDVGSSFRVRVVGTSSSIGTLTFRLRSGLVGGTNDTQVWVSTATVAQTANAHAGMEVLLTVRSLGSSGTVVGDGMAHAGAVLVPTLIGATTPVTLNTMGDWYIAATVACSSGAFTAQVGSIQAL